MSANVLYIGVSEVCTVLVCDNTDNMDLPHTVSTTAGFRYYPYQLWKLPSAKGVIHLCQACSNKDDDIY